MTTCRPPESKNTPESGWSSGRCFSAIFRTAALAASQSCLDANALPPPDHCAKGARKSRRGLPFTVVDGGIIRYQPTSASVAAWRTSRLISCTKLVLPFGADSLRTRWNLPRKTYFPVSTARTIKTECLRRPLAARRPRRRPDVRRRLRLHRRRRGTRPARRRPLPHARPGTARAARRSR